jgi:hypothetical protein
MSRGERSNLPSINTSLQLSEDSNIQMLDSDPRADSFEPRYEEPSSFGMSMPDLDDIFMSSASVELSTTSEEKPNLKRKLGDSSTQLSRRIRDISLASTSSIILSDITERILSDITENEEGVPSNVGLSMGTNLSERTGLDMGISETSAALTQALYNATSPIDGKIVIERRDLPSQAQWKTFQDTSLNYVYIDELSAETNIIADVAKYL